MKRKAYLSQSITDGFALVKVGEIPGVRVKFSNQDVGQTNENGEVLVPNLVSYYPNALSFEVKDLPINYEIIEAEKHVSPPFRGGGLVAFKIKKLQAFIGQFTLLEKGERSPAEYWRIEVTVKEAAEAEIFEQTIGRDGEFYLENIPDGIWPAQLYLKEKSCHFKIHVPESDEIMVDMGEVSCEIQ